MKLQTTEINKSSTFFFVCSEYLSHNLLSCSPPNSNNKVYNLVKYSNLFEFLEGKLQALRVTGHSFRFYLVYVIKQDLKQEINNVLTSFFEATKEFF